MELTIVGVPEKRTGKAETAIKSLPAEPGVLVRSLSLLVRKSTGVLPPLENDIGSWLAASIASKASTVEPAPKPVNEPSACCWVFIQLRALLAASVLEAASAAPGNAATSDSASTNHKMPACLIRTRDIKENPPMQIKNPCLRGKG